MQPHPFFVVRLLPAWIGAIEHDQVTRCSMPLSWLRSPGPSDWATTPHNQLLSSLNKAKRADITL